MLLQPDHKALIFFAAVAALGAGVRVVRAAGHDAAAAVQPALDRQMQAADSAAQTPRAGRGGGKGKGGQGSRASSGSKTKSKRQMSFGVGDSAQRNATRDSLFRRHRGPLDSPGWIGGKLDLDVATAAQMDSLPGVTPKMAKRIVADRMMRGPFLNRDGLRRVPGTGPLFMAAIDSLVTYSGTYALPSPSDTVVPKRKSARTRKSVVQPP